MTSASVSRCAGCTIASLAALGLTCSERDAPRGPAAPPSPAAALTQTAPSPAAAVNGRLGVVNGLRVLEVRGTPEEMGRAHGMLLGADVRRVVRDVLDPGSRSWDDLRPAVETMERFQPERFRREVRALAEAAGVDYLELMGLQLFGDAERGRSAARPKTTEELIRAPAPHVRPANGADVTPAECTSFAAFGPATATGELIAGRNFDYGFTTVAKYASLVMHARPEGRRAFVTLTWAGVVNGWTLMSDAGLVASNNTAASLHESLEGVSTCFLQRLIMEEATSVADGIEIARLGPRAVGTIMLVAGGSPPDAAVLEFDHGDFVVRRASAGYVVAANTCLELGRTAPVAQDALDPSGRDGLLVSLIRKHYGRIDRTTNFAAREGVAIASINLHSAMLFPSDLALAVSMRPGWSREGPYGLLRMTADGVVSAGDAARREGGAP